VIWFAFVTDQLPVRAGLAIPLAEIELRTSRSSGPGGQHANVTASRVEAVFDVAASRALSDAQRERITARLGPRVTASAQDTRSQARNRELALERLAARLAHALEVRRPRTATRPTMASKRRRLEGKRRRAEIKRGRRWKPDEEGDRRLRRALGWYPVATGG
jgi:ribosome-associated protein